VVNPPVGLVKLENLTEGSSFNTQPWDPWYICIYLPTFDIKISQICVGSKYIMTMDPSAGFPNKRFGSGVSNRKTLSQELLAGMLSEGPQVGNGGTQVIHWSLLNKLPCKTSKKHASKIQMSWEGKARASQSI